jgi:hypothetical protein
MEKIHAEKGKKEKENNQVHHTPLVYEIIYCFRHK